MPNLTITKEMIEDQNHWPWVLAKIESIMLWPDNEIKREKWKKSQSPLIFYRDAASKNKPLNEYPHGLLSKMLTNAINSPSREKQDEAANKIENIGQIIGNALLEVVGHHYLYNGDKQSLNKAFIYYLENTKGAMLEQEHLKNDWWLRYKSVAHFWAATVHMRQSCAEKELDLPFPCSGELLHVFVSLSEYYLQRGIALSPPRRKETDSYLNNENAWKIELDDERFLNIDIGWQY